MYAFVSDLGHQITVDMNKILKYSYFEFIKIRVVVSNLVLYNKCCIA